jgi:hypothetical protein
VSNAVQDIREFQVTTPAGTAITAPQITACTLPVGQVEWIEVFVPSGTRGALGIAVASSGQQIIPFKTGGGYTFFTPDNLQWRWDIVDYQDSGDWSVVTYNAGQWNHTIWVRFGLTYPDQTADTTGAAALPSLTVLNS